MQALASVYMYIYILNHSVMFYVMMKRFDDVEGLPTVEHQTCLSIHQIRSEIQLFADSEYDLSSILPDAEYRLNARPLRSGKLGSFRQCHRAEVSFVYYFSMPTGS